MRRIRVRWISTPGLAHHVQHFPEGSVHRFWFLWLFVRVMVPAKSTEVNS